MADKLIRMANQIASFWRYQPGQPPAQAVAAHINDFWTYQMRQDLLAALDRGDEADPLVREAAGFIYLPDDAARQA